MHESLTHQDKHKSIDNMNTDCQTNSQFIVHNLFCELVEDQTLNPVQSSLFLTYAYCHCHYIYATPHWTLHYARDVITVQFS